VGIGSKEPFSSPPIDHQAWDPPLTTKHGILPPPSSFSLKGGSDDWGALSWPWGISLNISFTSFLKGNGDETYEREEGKEWREDLVIVLRNGGEE
jgi:hypothetical protein